uniref:F-box domain-containing protein n=1 Tax=Alexandrium monilatum TaxID=311494 RepID=A0A7S4QUG5_9DINO
MVSVASLPHWEELALRVLGFLAPPDLGCAAAAAADWRGAAEHDEVWCKICRRRWESRCCTAFTGEGLRRLRRGEPPPGPDGEDRRAASWHWAYRTAEESAGVITVRDICGDFDGFPRVWAIHRCPPPFLGKQEAVFRRDGQRELHCVGQRGWHTWIGWHPAFLQSEARGGHLRGAALRRGLEAGTASLRPRGVLLRVSGPAGRRRLGGVGRQHAATPAVTCAFVC